MEEGKGEERKRKKRGTEGRDRKSENKGGKVWRQERITVSS